MTRGGSRSLCRGASLATALLLGALALTLALTLAGMSLSHLSVSTKLSNINQARSLAEAVVAQGIERVVSSQGEAFRAAPMTLTISFPDTPDGLGQLTFDPIEASELNIPISTNNLKGDTALPGALGRSVPSNAIHFVGVGKHRGVTRRIEAILHLPNYPYALSSKGSVVSTGEMTIAGAENLDQVRFPIRSHLDELLPGHIASNSTDPLGLNLIADHPIRITGDARSAGGIFAGPNAQIDGNQSAGAGPIDLPRIDLRDFDPLELGVPVGLPNDIPDLLRIKGLVRHSGDLQLDKLALPSSNSGAVLWVDGDLTINDGLEGIGAIFATGNISIRNAGVSDLQADNVCAVVAGKKLSIRGRSSQESSFFRGVVASGEDMDFSNVTVAGAAVAGVTALDGNDLSSPNPEMNLTDANVLSIPTEIGFEFKFPLEIGVGGAGGPDMGWAVPAVPSHNESMSLDIALHPDFRLEHLYREDTDRFETVWSAWDGFTPYSYDPATLTPSGSPLTICLYDPSHPNQWRPLSNRAELSGVLHTIAANAGPITNGLLPTHPEYREFSNWVEYFADPDTAHSSMNEVIDSMLTFALDQPGKGAKDKLAKANQWYAEQPNQPQQNGTFSMDPNQFVQWSGRTRIALWREL